VKHYRVNKLVKREGVVVKTKDILANNSREAMQAARDDSDCPICEVLHAGTRIGTIL
jgi:uncharacterized UPF0146 family protein